MESISRKYHYSKTAPSYNSFENIKKSKVNHSQEMGTFNIVINKLSIQALYYFSL